MTTEAKPLQPLDHGNILIVGTKQTNFGDEIKNHPRVIMWDSQNENWTGKELPQNVRAVFITRFIGHNAFSVIQKEARKKHITIFNPTGTGVIARQIKELLDLNKPAPVVDAPDPVTIPVTEVRPYTPTTTKELTETKVNIPGNSKLHVLIPLIDFNKSNKDNARTLIKHTIGATSTMASLANFVGTQRRKHGITEHTHPKRAAGPRAQHAKKTGDIDVAVQLFDDMIKQMKDMREFFVATVKENQALKARVDKLKRVIGED